MLLVHQTVSKSVQYATLTHLLLSNQKHRHFSILETPCLLCSQIELDASRIESLLDLAVAGLNSVTGPLAFP